MTGYHCRIRLRLCLVFWWELYLWVCTNRINLQAYTSFRVYEWINIDIWIQFAYLYLITCEIGRGYIYMSLPVTAVQHVFGRFLLGFFFIICDRNPAPFLVFGIISTALVFVVVIFLERRLYCCDSIWTTLVFVAWQYMDGLQSNSIISCLWFDSVFKDEGEGLINQLRLGGFFHILWTFESLEVHLIFQVRWPIFWVRWPISF